MGKYTKKDIMRIVADEDVEFIRMQFTDIFGQLKNVAITASQLEKALNNQIMIDGSSIEGFTRIHESDQYLYPDPDSFTILPWATGTGRTARLICDVYNPDGTPFIGDPRGVLKRALKKAAREARRKGVFETEKNGHSVYLDEFQLEELHEDVDRLELEMAQCETTDILNAEAFREEQDEAQREVRRIMRRRSGFALTLGTVLFALFLYALGLVPFVMAASRLHLLPESLMVSGVLILTVAVAALFALIYNRHLLMVAIGKFNEVMRSIVKRVQDSSRQYAEYLSALSSFMKGKSLLYQLMHGDESLDENEKLLRMHVHRLKECQRQLEEWCRPLDRALSRQYSQDSVRGFDYMKEDPKTSLYYVYQHGEQTYPVHLNEDAEYLSSPFSFIEQMIIRKEAES